jgi:hypothetical protein
VRRSLRHPADPDPLAAANFPFRGLERAGEEREERRLAGAVRADQRDDLARSQLEVERRERELRAEAARDTTRPDERLRPFSLVP